MPAIALILAACSPAEQQTTQQPTDTSTEEPNILPIDTSNFIPIDTAATAPVDIAPDNFVFMNQTGVWNLSDATAPTSMSGLLQIAEYIDTLDTALPVYECYVTYALTGGSVGNHTCPTCDFVFDVEFYASEGDPSACHDPDAPPAGAVWQMGWSNADASILLNYYGTDVWLPWYDGTKSGTAIDFAWSTTLAIEVVDTGMTQ